MSLMKCPECGEEVSSEADFCPHCGKRLDVDRAGVKKSKRWKGFLIAAVAAVVLVVLALWGMSSCIDRNVQSINDQLNGHNASSSSAVITVDYNDKASVESFSAKPYVLRDDEDTDIYPFYYIRVKWTWKNEDDNPMGQWPGTFEAYQGDYKLSFGGSNVPRDDTFNETQKNVKPGKSRSEVYYMHLHDTRRNVEFVVKNRDGSTAYKKTVKIPSSWKKTPKREWN